MTGVAEARALPELRSDLRLLAGAAGTDGQPRWLIQDLASNRFLQIDSVAYEALTSWAASPTDAALIERVNSRGRANLDAQSLADLVQFLHLNELTVGASKGGWAHHARRNRSRQQSLLMRLVHNYLFFRIPLVRPQAFLLRTLWAVRRVWSRPALLLISVLGVIGSYLASRQWDAFVSTFQASMTFEGALFAILTLGAVKLAHESGHAYMAAHFGCRVHSMGLAFLVMTPMPYTDVTDAWRLRDRRHRLLIDGAGILAELMLAAVAIFIWGLLADGPLRSLAFFVATVSFASSLAINLNPFMRFDGYYLLSEVTGTENLQERSFAVGRWMLREMLFGLGLSCPEEGKRGLILWLSIYAWLVWLYRLAVFLGIALLVYHFFFKLLGIVLFAVEIVYFIARPVVSELRTWWDMRRLIFSEGRALASLGSLGIFAALGVVPLGVRVEVPAVLEAAHLQSLHAVRPARVSAVLVKPGDAVRRGDVIAELVSSDVDDDMRRNRIALRTAHLQYGRRGSDASDRESSLVLESTIGALEARIAGLARERRDLSIAAPFDGVVADFNPDVHVGRWLGPRDFIAVIADGQGKVVRGYVAEADIGRIGPGSSARFVPEHPSRGALNVRIERVAQGNSPQIEIPDLASIHAGPIPTILDGRRHVVATGGQYLVSGSVTDTDRAASDLAVRGVLHVEASPESLLGRAWRRALAVLVRESGF